jgi:hypothetical protein
MRLSAYSRCSLDVGTAAIAAVKKVTIELSNRPIAAGGSCGVQVRADTPLVTTQRRALDCQVESISI